MQVTVTTADGYIVAQVAAEPQHTIASIAQQLEQKFGIPAALQQLLLDGRPLQASMTFEQAGVKDDDLLVIARNPSADGTQAPAPLAPIAANPSAGFTARPGMRIHDIPPNASAEVLLEIIDKNPQLLPQIQQGNPPLGEALLTKSVPEVRKVLLKMYMEAASRTFQEQEEMLALERNPFDPNAQAKIAERIRLANVQANMEMALEEMPESFARVTMLYIPCEVNGHKVKAFVDSGAQSTIMSSGCAERCGIMRLVDKRMAGQAVGVGTAKIIGRVHLAPLKIDNVFYNCSFTILDQQNVDFLFGLDMLKRHQCCIDLRKNVLRLADGDDSHEVPFLPEHEIPSSERMEDDSATAQPDSSSTPVSSAVAPTPAVPPAAIPQSPAPSAGDQDKIAQLVALGFNEQRARQALQTTGGNVELAAGLLFESMN